MVSIVAEGASNILVQHSASADEALRRIAGDSGVGDNHRLWAIYTLLRMGIFADNLLAQIPNSQIPLPEAIPQALRNAIVGEWARYDAPLSDIRWMIEGQQLSENGSYEAATLIELLRVELQAAGLQTGEAIDCGEYHAQGGGTYWLLPIATDEENIERYLYVSKLGPFVSYAIHVITRYENGSSVSYHLTNLGDIDPIGLWKEQSMVCRQFAEDIGFTWVDETILDIVVPRLCAPYPYQPDAVTVRLLLYYWID